MYIDAVIKKDYILNGKIAMVNGKHQNNILIKII